MKATNIVLTVIFALFAIVQYNDPDPLPWIAMYGFVAVVSAFAINRRYNRYVLLAGLAVCVVWMVTILPGFLDWIEQGMPSITGSMKAESPYIEYTREFFGLLLGGGVLVFHYVQALKQRVAAAE